MDAQFTRSFYVANRFYTCYDTENKESKMKKISLIIFILIVACYGYIKIHDNNDSVLKELNQAIQQNNEAQIKEILAKNPNVDLNPPFVFGYMNKPLFIAARSSTPEILSLLLQHGADINGICSYQDTPLITALENHKYENAKFLIEHGADVNKPNSYGMSPFIGLCAGYGPFDLFVLAFEKGGELNKSYPITVCAYSETVDGHCPVRHNSTCLEMLQENSSNWSGDGAEEKARKKIREYLSQKGLL